jgi:hypothetical protein
MDKRDPLLKPVRQVQVLAHDTNAETLSETLSLTVTQVASLAWWQE